MVGQPFIYDAIPKATSKHPYNEFDPKAVSRASLTPKAPRPKPDGPLVSFNQHPDSYLILPYGNSNAKPMNPKVKIHIKYTRIFQLVLRCLELLGAIGLLVTMILVSKVNIATGWLMRMPPGVAILHTMYGVYHLGRSPGGRTPGSSASYMLFSAAFDASIIPFYVFAALMSSSQYKLAQTGTGKSGQWSSLLPAGQSLMPILSGTAFLCSVIAGGFHLISLGLSLWLAVTFRKITKLPPDMNPLEDNLTSRHKRNKSSLSVSTVSEKRISEPLENRRKSGAPYEELARPPTIPFFHTRQGSSDSFTTYQSTPPGSRDSRLELPSRQYQIQTRSNSPRTSVADLKRTSYHAPASPPKRATYTEVPLSDNASYRSSRPAMGNLTEAWYTANSLPATKSGRSSSHKAAYHPLFNNNDDDEDISSAASGPHPNPLEANPPGPRQSPNKRQTRSSALSEISLNTSVASGDLADESRDTDAESKSKVNQFKSKYYGELRAATPPILIATANGRQVSSGTDIPTKKGSQFAKRDVSGKIAEEGRGGGIGGWGTRFRKVSGM